MAKSETSRLKPDKYGLSPGGQDEHPGLFRLVSEGPGSGVRVLNKPEPRHSGIDPLRRAEPLRPCHATCR